MIKHLIILTLFNTFILFQAQAQEDSVAEDIICPCDTITQAPHFKYKIGVKIMNEQSADYSVKGFSHTVYSGGIQLIRAIGSTPSSIESGVYMITKANEYNYPTYHTYWDPVEQTWFLEEQSNPMVMHYYNLSIPVNYRYDLRFIYFSGGVMIDYLIGEKVVKNALFLDSIGYKPEEMRKLNWGYNLTLGGERCVNERVRIFGEVKFTQTLSSSKTTNGDFYFDPSYCSWGVAIGASYKLY